MTPEELDEARAKEAERLWSSGDPNDPTIPDIATVAARLAREGWTPPEPEPEPVDPDILAWREWAAKDWVERYPAEVDDVQRGKRDGCDIAKAFVAGARMAREQERERAKVLVEFAEDIAKFSRNYAVRAYRDLAKYRGEA